MSKVVHLLSKHASERRHLTERAGAAEAQLMAARSQALDRIIESCKVPRAQLFMTTFVRPRRGRSGQSLTRTDQAGRAAQARETHLLARINPGGGAPCAPPADTRGLDALAASHAAALAASLPGALKLHGSSAARTGGSRGAPRSAARARTLGAPLHGGAATHAERRLRSPRLEATSSGTFLDLALDNVSHFTNTRAPDSKPRHCTPSPPPLKIHAAPAGIPRPS